MVRFSCCNLPTCLGVHKTNSQYGFTVLQTQTTYAPEAAGYIFNLHWSGSRECMWCFECILRFLPFPQHSLLHQRKLPLKASVPFKEAFDSLHKDKTNRQLFTPMHTMFFLKKGSLDPSSLYKIIESNLALMTILRNQKCRILFSPFFGQKPNASQFLNHLILFVILGFICLARTLLQPVITATNPEAFTLGS